MTLSYRQNQILDAAIQLVADLGIQGLTMSNLATAIGISEPAIYRHFESKCDILLAALDRFRRENHGLYEMAVKECSDEVGAIDAIFSNLFKQFQMKPALAAVIFSEEIFQNDQRLSGQVLEIMDRSHQKLTELLTLGQEHGLIRDDVEVDYLSLTLHGAVRLLVTRWRLTGFRIDLQQEGQRLIRSLKILIERKRS